MDVTSRVCRTTPSKNMPQQSIVSSTVVQMPQTFGLQVTKFIHTTSAPQSSGAVHRSFPIIVAAGSSWNDRGGWVSGGAGVVVVALVLSKSMHAYNCMYAYVNTNAGTYCVSMSA